MAAHPYEVLAGPTDKGGVNRPRRITPELWEQHYQQIRDLYVCTAIPLTKIKQTLLREKCFNPTIKQWKDQLKKWKLKRYLDKLDAALVLYLHSEAESQGIYRIVKFFEKEKTYSDIQKYINKHKSIENEEQLLESFCPQTVHPRYITYVDRPRGFATSTAPESVQTMLQPPPQPSIMADGTADGDAIVQFSDAHSPWPVRDRERSSQGGMSSSQDGLMTPPDELDGELELLPEDILTEFNHFDAQNMNLLGLDAVASPFFQPDILHQNHAQAQYITELASSTPLMFDSSKQNLVLELEMLGQISAITTASGSKSRDNPTFTSSASFLINCIRMCIYRGQEAFALAEAAMKNALSDFGNVVYHETEDTLIVLNSLVTLFESLGQRSMAAEVLERLLTPTNSLIFPEWLTETINFMLSIPGYRGQHRPNYDLGKLRDIHNHLVEGMGEKSQLALAAAYNLGWAELEMGKFQEARRRLMDLRSMCESAFGGTHMQSITCVATLARAHLKCDESISAEGLISEVVVPRIKKAFPNTHPYYWEAQNRQAVFWVHLAGGNGPEAADRLVQAEKTLRNVLDWRFAFLGPENPRTNCTFKILQKLLERQGNHN